MDLAQNLDDFIEVQAGVKYGFEVTDLNTADWCVRKIAKAQADIDQIDELAKQRIDQIKAWQEKSVQEHTNTIAFFEALLEPYAKQQITGKKKSMKLPTGTFGFKAQQPDFIKDDEKLLAWADENAKEYIKIKKEVEWGELKKACTVAKMPEITPFGKMEKTVLISPDGQVIDSVTVVERGDKFYVKVGN